MKNALIVFVKNPVLGKVKTRLARTIGNEKALVIYQKLIAHTQAICKNVTAEKFIFYSDWVVDDSEWNAFEPRLQTGADLGERMENAFTFLFEEPAFEKTVIIGSDCYEITTHIIENAFTQLSLFDIVIGPAADGGYYLLGMNEIYASLFENKTWSTDAVLQETLQTISSLQLSVYLLPELKDIDEEKDLAGTPLINE